MLTEIVNEYVFSIYSVDLYRYTYVHMYRYTYMYIHIYIIEHLN